MANTDINVKFSEYRPCIVDGRRALFHRWADNARPVVPRGMPEDETTERYQLYTVQALVEFEDGTVCRRWPYEVQFLDSAAQFAAQSGST